MRQSVASIIRINVFSTAALVGALLLGTSGCNHGQQRGTQTSSTYSSQNRQYRTSQPQTYSKSSSGMHRRQQPSSPQYGSSRTYGSTSRPSSGYGARSGSSTSGTQQAWQQNDSGAESTLGSSSRINETSPSFSSSGRQQGSREQRLSSMSQRPQAGAVIERAQATLHGVGGNHGSGTIEFSQAGRRAVKIHADIQGLQRGSYNVVVASSALCPTGTSPSDMGSSSLQGSGSTMGEGSRSSSQMSHAGSQSGMSSTMGSQSGSTMGSQSGQPAQGHQGSQVASSGRQRTRLGLLRVSESGSAQRQWSTSQASIKGPNSVLGRSVLIISRAGAAPASSPQQGTRARQSSQGQVLACGVIQTQGF